MNKSQIAWCDSTINFWSGCTKVSPGCAHCYAETRDKRHMIEKVSHWGKGAPRLKHKGAVKDALAMNRKPWICPICAHAMTEAESKSYTGCPVPVSSPLDVGCSMLDVRCSPKAGHGPALREKVMHVAQHHRRRIFSLSLGDWLDDEVPIEWLAEMLDTIRQCDQVTWILCTKRPENFWQRTQDALWKCEGLEPDDDGDSEDLPRTPLGDMLNKWIGGEPPKNIIVLTSVENQEQADKRIPELKEIPAACHGLSVEPMLGPIDFSKWLNPSTINSPPSTLLDWVIFGGESGDQARPCNVEWIRQGVQQCQTARVPAFVKQLGSNSDFKIVPMPTTCGNKECRREISPSIGWCTYCDWHPNVIDLKDKKGGDITEFPADLRVREFPKLS